MSEIEKAAFIAGLFSLLVALITSGINLFLFYVAGLTRRNEDFEFSDPRGALEHYQFFSNPELYHDLTRSPGLHSYDETDPENLTPLAFRKPHPLTLLDILLILERRIAAHAELSEVQKELNEIDQELGKIMFFLLTEAESDSGRRALLEKASKKTHSIDYLVRKLSKEGKDTKLYLFLPGSNPLAALGTIGLLATGIGFIVYHYTQEHDVLFWGTVVAIGLLLGEGLSRLLFWFESKPQNPWSR
jgi:hypothetical protein